MRILVTGGAGFIGSHVVDAYIEAGHEVFVVDDLSTGKQAQVHPRAHFVRADIQDVAVRRLMVEERIEVLNHHAAQMDVRRSVADPLFDARVNILGLLNLLEGAREAGMKKVLFASSGGTVYGEQELFPAPEDHPTRPISPYGVSKRAGEHYLYFYQVQYGIPYIALRYANVYGPRQDPHGEAGVVAIFTLRLLSGGQPIINGDGKQTRDYVFVSDVARANVAALEASYTGPLNIGTGIETDVNQLFHALRVLTNPAVPEVHGPAKPGEQRRSVLAWDRAAAVLGWRPQVALADGLQQTVAYFRTHHGHHSHP
ncbi:MAG: NAD-dependent epimerase/dehydratase family protein [Candidatus Binatia bacterium]|nr:NAD-dependent epimerase/dehydratase family protein [Candidatus Binatia bacterium]